MIAALSVAAFTDAYCTPGRHGHPRRSLVHQGLRVPPALEPRYDDQLAEPQSYTTADPLPFDKPWPRRFDHDVDFFDPQPTSRRSLPEPRRWTSQFLLAVLEMLAGRRPVGQLQQWATLPAVAGMKTAVLRYAQTTQVSRTTRGASFARSHRGAPFDTVHSLRVAEPADGVAEVCAVLRRGDRYRALTARLEGFDGRWQCVAFRLL